MIVRPTRSLWMLAVVALAACGSDGDTTVAAETPAGDAPASEVSCDDSQRFVELLDGRGIEVDHQPSQSPAELASHADVVFGGKLTGRLSTTEMVSTDDPNPWRFVGFEVEVTRIAKGTADIVEVGEVVEVFVEFAPPSMPDLSEGDLVVAGTPVVVFAVDHPELGELTAFVPEGFMTSCPGEPLLGQSGTEGQWLALDGLDAVLDAARTGDPTTTTEPTTAAPSDGPSALPDRAATVTGTVGTDEAGRLGVLDDPSESYYAGMGLRQGDPIVVDTSTGQQVPFESLRQGERISVWVDGGCRESFPVQCDITAIGVQRDV